VKLCSQRETPSDSAVSNPRLWSDDEQPGSYQLARWVSTDKRACVYQLNSTCLVSAVLFHMTRKLRGVRSRLRKRCLTVLDRHVISVQLPWDSNGVEIPK